MSELVSRLSLRRATPDDAARLAEIQARAVEDGGRHFYDAAVIAAWAWGSDKREACRGWIGEAGIHVVLCERQGTAHGFAVYVAKDESVYVHSLYCHPDAGGRGIGRALLADIESFARSVGKSRVTAQSSLNAVGFYRAQGFVRVGDGFQEIGSDRLRWDYVAMAKALSA
jgi:putative acetyltransferase